MCVIPLKAYPTTISNVLFVMVVSEFKGDFTAISSSFRLDCRRGAFVGVVVFRSFQS